MAAPGRPPPGPGAARAAAARLVAFGFDGAGDTPPAGALALARAGCGGVVLFGRNAEGPEQVSRLCGALKEAAPGPLLTLVDQEGGRVARLPPPGFSAVPAARDLGAGPRPERAAGSAGATIGRELRRSNIDMDLAPVVDVDSNPRNPVIGDRSFGPEPRLVGKCGAAFVRGLQGEGVGACAKHFPGHGDTELDSHFDFPVLRHGVERLEAVELPPFRDAVDAGVAAVLVAHVAVPALEADGAVRPASSSAAAVRCLREGLGFRGVVMTDDLEMAAVEQAHGGAAAAAVAGLRAGVDMFLVCHSERKQWETIDALAAAVESGYVSWERLLEAHGRVSELMRRFARPPRPPETVRVWGAPGVRNQVMSLLQGKRVGGAGGGGEL